MALNWLAKRVTCRRILFIMVTTGFALNGILKTVFTIAIIAMIKTNNESTTDHFDWNEEQKQNILGIFFWGFAFTKIPSGRLSELFGSRLVSGYSMGLSGFLTILTPSIARWNYHVLLITRILMGLLVGSSWPAIMPLGAKWFGSNEQSMFMTCLAASATGYVLSSFLGGLIISEFGWSSWFYIIGVISLFWTIIWFYLIYDSPQQHPRITKKEKLEIEKKIKQTQQVAIPIPIMKILASGPVWAIAFAQISAFFATMVITTELPSYLDQVLKFNIKENGILSAIPNCGVYVMALLYSLIADYLIKSKILSTTTVRRIFSSIALILPSVFMLILSFWGYVSSVAISLFFLSLSCTAAQFAGHCANILDISPNFSGTICGFVNAISSIGVYFFIKLLGSLLKNGHTFQEWRAFFWILSVSYSLGGIVYLIFSSGKLQSWDSKESKEEITIGNEEMLLDNKS